MRRICFFVYGVLCYALFLGVFAYAIGFIGDCFVPTSLDGESQGAIGLNLIIDVTLLTVFALQHSIMARPSFKRWWTRFVPSPIERSTYVLCSNLALILLFCFWRPLSGVVWELDGTGRVVIYSMYALGWVTVLYATFLVNNFDLFGLRQVWLYLRNQPYTPLPFREASLYKYVRHPLYVGWIMVFWFAPTMTIAHLMFAMITTTYILVAIRFEERDLARALPGYREYRRRVPMLIPARIASRRLNAITRLDAEDPA